MEKIPLREVTILLRNGQRMTGIFETFDYEFRNGHLSRLTWKTDETYDFWVDISEVVMITSEPHYAVS